MRPVCIAVLFAACGPAPLPEYGPRDLAVDSDRSCVRPDAPDSERLPTFAIEAERRFTLEGRFRTRQGDSSEADGRPLGLYDLPNGEPVQQVTLGADGFFSFDLVAPDLGAQAGARAWPIHLGLADLDEPGTLDAQVITPHVSGTSLLCAHFTDATGLALLEARQGDAIEIRGRASIETIDPATVALRAGDVDLADLGPADFDAATGRVALPWTVDLPWGELTGDAVDVVATMRVDIDDGSGDFVEIVTEPLRVPRP